MKKKQKIKAAAALLKIGCGILSLAGEPGGNSKYEWRDGLRETLALFALGEPDPSAIFLTQSR